MIEIIVKNGQITRREVDHVPEPELQVPDISRDPERIRQHMRRLMQEEDLRAAEEEQPIVDAINTVALMACSMVIGMLLMMIR